MAKLEVTDEEADRLCDILGLEKESWEAELERIIVEETFDSWEDLLAMAGVSQDTIRLLKKLLHQLGGEEVGRGTA